jgi:hypothetical protein
VCGGAVWCLSTPETGAKRRRRGSDQDAAVSRCEICAERLDTFSRYSQELMMQPAQLRACSLLAFVCGTAATTVAWPGDAQAMVVVNVAGTHYEVSTFTGSYLDNIDHFTTSEMPWFGNNPLALQFAEAVGANLGFPNGEGFLSPLYAVGLIDFNEGESVVSGFQYNKKSAVLSGEFGFSASGTYALATPVLAPSAVPGPLPLFGAAAAFSWSRRLRRRASRGPLARQQPARFQT